MFSVSSREKGYAVINAKPLLSVSRVICLALTMASCTMQSDRPTLTNSIVTGGPTATIKDSTRSGEDPKLNKDVLTKAISQDRVLKAQFYFVKAINGQEVSNAFEQTVANHRGLGQFMKLLPYQRAVPAGSLRLTLEARAHYGAPINTLMDIGDLNETQTVTGSVELFAEAGKTFRVNGKLDSGHSAVWVEDDAGTIVTQVLEKRSYPSWLDPLAPLEINESRDLGAMTLGCHSGFRFSRDCNFVSGPNHKMSIGEQRYKIGATENGSVILVRGGDYRVFNTFLLSKGITVRAAHSVRSSGKLFALVFESDPGAYDKIIASEKGKTGGKTGDRP